MKNNLSDSESVKKYITEKLAEHIGVDLEDINDDDFFTEDLHMTPADLSDFIEQIGSEGIDTSKIDLTITETVGDLLDTLTSQAEII